MGNQGHANEGPRILNELIWQGAIGDVIRVHCWTDRPVWLQGIQDTPVGEKIPESLEWDLWLGPAAYRPYSSKYVPFDWRAYWDFGCGALGDMGCHIMDYPFWALNLKAPESIEAYSTSVNDISAPHASTIKYQFINGLNQSPVEVIWYDGGLKPFMPKGLTSDTKLWEKGSGVIFEGKEGTIIYGHHRPKPILIINNREIDYKQPEQKIERSIGHYREWISEIKGEGKKAMSNFNYAGPLNEAVLLGNVALRAGRRIEWNPDEMEITNYSEANIYLRDKVRDGWRL